MGSAVFCYALRFSSRPVVRSWEVRAESMLDRMFGRDRVARGLKRFTFICAAVIALGALVPELGAQDRNALVRLLQTQGDFRIRVQAAFAMGTRGDRAYSPYLVTALRDPNPAVRAAAA